MNSSAILSNSVHITEDGFKRMKEDPEYRKEIMDWLRADARASHGVPIAAHVTTTITGSGAIASRKRNAAHRERLGARQQPDAVTSAVVINRAAETGVHARHPAQLFGDEAAVHASRHAVHLLQGHHVGRDPADDLGDAAEVLYVVRSAAVSDVVTHEFHGRGLRCAGRRHQGAEQNCQCDGKILLHDFSGFSAKVIQPPLNAK